VSIGPASLLAVFVDSSSWLLPFIGVLVSVPVSAVVVSLEALLLIIDGAVLVATVYSFVIFPPVSAMF